MLDAIHRELEIPERLRARLAAMMKLGIIESRGHGRGTFYLLSEQFYQFAGSRGEYTRRRGLDTETNKALLLDHIKRNNAEGSPFRDLQAVLPTRSRQQVQRLLAELKAEGRSHVRGKTRGARWYLHAEKAGGDSQ